MPEIQGLSALSASQARVMPSVCIGWSRLLPVGRPLHHRPKKKFECKNFDTGIKQNSLFCHSTHFVS